MSLATKTLDNLMAAFNGESNARAKYLAFARKADEEGYETVASLFRAAARAEEIHAYNHGLVIKKMGGTPLANIKTPEVKSTRENLEAAIAGETYERDVMYPEFIRDAEAEKNAAAVRTCKAALAAEIEHARLYTEALNHLENWRQGKKDFFICEVCGYTVTEIPQEKCPVCFARKEKFIKVN